LLLRIQINLVLHLNIESLFKVHAHLVNLLLEGLRSLRVNILTDLLLEPLLVILGILVCQSLSFQSVNFSLVSSDHKLLLCDFG
jgi:hypothetical protein